MSVHIPSLSPALNQRATTLVIESIAQHPQSWAGPDMLIGAAVLREFHRGRPATGGVGLRELALVQADPEPTAAQINRLHEIFGIDVVVTPERARSYVYTGAVYAILAVYDNTVYAAERAGVELPARLADAPYRDCEEQWIEPIALWRDALALHGVLKMHPAVRDKVIDDIGFEAEMTRRATRSRQTEVQAAYWEKRQGETAGDSCRPVTPPA